MINKIAIFIGLLIIVNLICLLIYIFLLTKIGFITTLVVTAIICTYKGIVFISGQCENWFPKYKKWRDKEREYARNCGGM